MADTMSRDHVSPDAFRHSLAQALDCPRHPECGLFGPGSMTWRISRHSALFIGGFRALLLQVAHPWVANGARQHSAVYDDPIGRFHRTFRRVFTIVFGNMQQVSESAHHMHAMHATVKGELASPTPRWEQGTHYEANQVHALLWVAATLWDSSVSIYELAVEPLTPHEKEQYYEECFRYAAVFGIPASAMPRDWSEFQQYFNDTLHSDILSVDDWGRNLSDFLFHELPVSFLSAPRARILTAELLPEHLRAAFALPPPTPCTRRVFRNTILWFRLGYRCLPRHVKYVPAYFEALARLEARTRAPRTTRLMNRLWIGQPELVFTPKRLVRA